MQDNKRILPPEPEDILEKHHPVFMDKKGEAVVSATANLSNSEYQVDGNAESSKVTLLMAGAIILIVIMGGVWFFWSQIFAQFSGLVGFNLDQKNEGNKEVVIDDKQASGDEVKVDELTVDSDKDGLVDAEESVLGLDANNPDTDDDGLSDKDEIKIYSSDPFKADSDSDNFLDGEEVRYGFDPNGSGRLDDILKVISE